VYESDPFWESVEEQAEGSPHAFVSMAYRTVVEFCGTVTWIPGEAKRVSVPLPRG